MSARKNTSSYVLLISLLGSNLFGCYQRVDHGTAYSEALVVHPRAKDVKFSKYEGTDHLSYRVEEKFPASAVVGWVAYQLGEKNWEPLPDDYLNPGLPSSHLRGWTKFIDATKPTEHVVNQWLADWKDKSGNIVRYVFHYSYPKDGNANLTDLEVTAVYMPAAIATKGLEAGRKLKEKSGRIQSE